MIVLYVCDVFVGENFRIGCYIDVCGAIFFDDRFYDRVGVVLGGLVWMCFFGECLRMVL